MANITLSAPQQLLDKARQVARRQGTSLNELVRRHLRALVGDGEEADAAAELLTLMRKNGGRSGGRRWRRADAYEGRLK